MTAVATTGLQVRDVRLGLIFADSDFNCRGLISPLDVTDLARDMQENTLQNPILIRPYSSPEQPQFEYEIISGFRRFRSAQVLEWPTIPAIVRTDIDDIQARILNLSENVNRRELNKVQEAKSINALVLAGLTQEEIADKIHQSRGWVQIRIAVLNLPREIQKEIADGMLTDAHIREVNKMDSIEDKFEAVKKIKGAKERGEKVPSLKKPNKNPLLKKKRELPEMRAMLEHIQDYLGNGLFTRVLAWATGEISDNDLFHDIQKACMDKGISYAIPHQSLPTAE